jgi:hypothetical protein
MFGTLLPTPPAGNFNARVEPARLQNAVVQAQAVGRVSTVAIPASRTASQVDAYVIRDEQTHRCKVVVVFDTVADPLSTSSTLTCADLVIRSDRIVRVDDRRFAAEFDLALAIPKSTQLILSRESAKYICRVRDNVTVRGSFAISSANGTLTVTAGTRPDAIAACDSWQALQATSAPRRTRVVQQVQFDSPVVTARLVGDGNASREAIVNVIAQRSDAARAAQRRNTALIRPSLIPRAS